MPCYGTIEGPIPPFFGSTDRLAIDADETDLLHFLASRGYAIRDAGDVSNDIGYRPTSAIGCASARFGSMGTQHSPC